MQDAAEPGSTTAQPAAAGDAGRWRPLALTWLPGLACAAAAGVLHAAAILPGAVPEAAYVFLVPLLLWLGTRPAWKVVAVSGLLGFGFAWLHVIFWMRHVTLVGTVALAFTVGLLQVGWLLAARWAWPRMTLAAFPTRALGLLALAGLWVVVEQLRGWLFTGFPWLPLAASQASRPALLQILPWTGAAGLTFALVGANVGLASYVRQLRVPRAGKSWWARLCPDFHLGLGLVLVCFAFGAMPGTYAREREVLAAVALVQPDIDQPDKWDPAQEEEIREVLGKLTLFGAAQGADIVAWPEAVTTWPVRVKPAPAAEAAGTRAWVESQAALHRVAILMGNLEVHAPEGDAPVSEATWFNTVDAVSADHGLGPAAYRQRHLVPFGQYVPFGDFLPFLRKIVPIGGDFTPSRELVTVPIEVRGRVLKVGGLICYEDSYASLARENARAGVDFHFVPTNNAWFGDEGGAEQHAQHSILRAAETRRPVVRVGNAGWSGIIDEYGNVRHVLLDPAKGPYFRGVSTGLLTRDVSWAGRETFYVRHGEWLAWLSLLLVAGAWAALRGIADVAPPPPDDSLVNARTRGPERRSFARRRFAGGSGG